jgi:hypothetical protein
MFKRYKLWGRLCSLHGSDTAPFHKDGTQDAGTVTQLILEAMMHFRAPDPSWVPSPFQQTWRGSSLSASGSSIGPVP